VIVAPPRTFRSSAEKSRLAIAAEMDLLIGPVSLSRYFTYFSATRQAR
jgi:hypothetical protein